jgi:hypothetical protein
MSLTPLIVLTHILAVVFGGCIGAAIICLVVGAAAYKEVLIFESSGERE